MTPDVKKCLESAAALLRAGWCRKAFARDSRGGVVGIQDPTAQSFCLVGAVMKAADGDRKVCGKSLDALRAAIGVDDLSAWNDSRWFSLSARRAFRKAITS